MFLFRITDALISPVKDTSHRPEGTVASGTAPHAPTSFRTVTPTAGKREPFTVLTITEDGIPTVTPTAGAIPVTIS